MEARRRRAAGAQSGGNPTICGLIQQPLLVLDCCYSGAFMSGMEYAFESSGGVSGEGATSIFADAFVRSLATGDADRDRDGWVTIDDRYDYLYEQVKTHNPHQKPSKLGYGVSGMVVIARNPTIEAAVPPERCGGRRPTPPWSR